MNTAFTDIYRRFKAKITDDMYMELTPEDLKGILEKELAKRIPFL